MIFFSYKMLKKQYELVLRTVSYVLRVIWIKFRSASKARNFVHWAVLILTMWQGQFWDFCFGASGMTIISDVLLPNRTVLFLHVFTDLHDML